VLRDAGLVTVEQAGRSRLYRADTAALSELRQFFDDFWSTAADRLLAVAETAAAERRRAS
jgi:DNA-binding transcriptional ArsR family regulator